MLKKFYIFYNSLILAFVIAISAFKIEWLEMRMNIGLLVPVAFVVIAICFFVLDKDRKTLYMANRILCIGILCVSLLFSVVLLRGSIFVVPASIIREGIGFTKLPFFVVNICISLFVILGLFVILLGKSAKKVQIKKIQNGKAQVAMKKIKTSQIVLAVIVIGLLCIYFLLPSVRGYVNHIVALFASGDTSKLKEFIASYGTYAMVISFCLMVFQSVMAPLPAFLITFANANLFGWWQGAILSWTSAMAGSVLCFFIARTFGRGVTEKFTTKTGLAEIDKFFDKYGAYSILIARLLPFISFDIVSYAAGLTSINLLSFLVATGLGQLPATIVYSYVGGMLSGGTRLFVTSLLIIFALFALGFMLKKLFAEKGKNVKPKDEAR